MQQTQSQSHRLLLEDLFGKVTQGQRGEHVGGSHLEVLLAVCVCVFILLERRLILGASVNKRDRMQDHIRKWEKQKSHCCFLVFLKPQISLKLNVMTVP